MKPYFHGRVDKAFHPRGTFKVGDRVKVVSAHYPIWPHRTGVIVRLVHSNHGKGRIYAVVREDDGKEFKAPLGRCKKVT